MAAIMVSTEAEDVSEIARVRDGIANYLHTRTGAHVSDVTVGCVIDECRAVAIQRGVGLVDAARDICRITSAHLHKHNGDAGAALTTVDHSIGIDGVALLVLIIAQKRVRTGDTI
jgi:hypothetical protein